MKYFSRRYRPFAVEDNLKPSDRPMSPSITVSDHKARDTGLLDANGDPIMRAPRPVGFGREEEW